MSTQAGDTGRELARDALRERERNARLVMESIPGLVALLTVEGQVYFANRRLLEFTGRPLEELQHWGTNGTVYPSDLPSVVEVFSRSIATGTPYEIVQRLRRSDGHYRWFKNEGSPLRDEDGNIVGWCVLLTDIDEQKHAEEALRESERESRRIVESIPGLIVTLTETGVVAFENSRTRHYLGPELAGTIEWTTSGIVHPEDVPRVLPIFMRGVESRAPFEYEVRLRRFDGAHRWFQLRAHPFTDDDGRVIHWYVLFTDIDDRKRAEDAIRASEQQFKLITDTIPALAWSALPDGSADYFNQHFLDFIGLRAEQASGWGWMSAVHPDDVQALALKWQRIVASGGPGEAEARLRCHDGSYRWFLLRMNPLRDETGNISKWYGVNTDIEDRKRAEQDLRASELNLRQMTETIPEMLWSATPDGAIDYCNTRFLAYTGFSAAEVVNDGWQRTIHPEDAARVGPMWMASVSRRKPYRVEVRTYHAADQTYRWCAVSALPLLDEDGTILKWHGTIVDVHDWKQAQENLRRSEAFLAEAQHLSATGSFSWRPRRAKPRGLTRCTASSRWTRRFPSRSTSSGAVSTPRTFRSGPRRWTAPRPGTASPWISACCCRTARSGTCTRLPTQPTMPAESWSTSARCRMSPSGSSPSRRSTRFARSWRTWSAPPASAR